MKRRHYLACCGLGLAAGTVPGHTAATHRSGETTPVWPVWEGYRGSPRNAGRSPEEHSLSTEPERSWDVSVSGEYVGTVAHRGFVYAAYGDTIVGIDAASGQRTWTSAVETPIEGHPAVTEAGIVLPTRDGVTLIDGKDGRTEWTETRQAAAMSVLTNAAGVYAGWSDGRLTRHDPGEGSVLDAVELSGAIERPIASFGSLVVVVTESDTVAGIQNGAVLWESEFDASLESPPVVSNGPALVTTFEGDVLAIDIGNGETLHRYETGDRVPIVPAVYNGTAVTATFDDRLYAFDSTTGSDGWTREAETRVRDAVVDETTVYTLTFRGIEALSLADGTTRWNLPIEFARDVLISAEGLVVATEDGVVGYDHPEIGDSRRIVVDLLRTVTEGEYGRSVEGTASRAADAFLDGAFDDARESAADAFETIEAQRSDRERAETAVAELSSFLETNDELVFDEAIDRLRAARSAAAEGSYTEARELAEAGLDAARQTDSIATEADSRIGSLGSELESAPDRIDFGPAEDRHEAAKQAYETGEYETARSLAVDGIEAIDRIARHERESRRLIGTLEALRGSVAGTPAKRRWVVTLDAARVAYDAGEYETALERAERARRQFLLDTTVLGVGATAFGLGLFRARRSYFPI